MPDNTEELRKIIKEHVKKYPLLKMTDLVKLCYQNEFGGEHLVKDAEAVGVKLKEEFSQIPYTPEKPLTESIGNGIVRLNLGALPKDTNLGLIGNIFALSAKNHKGKKEMLTVKLGLLEIMASCGELPFSAEEVRNYTNNYAKAGFCPVSHSDTYKANYHPAYRVVDEKYISLLPIAEKALTLAEDGKRVVIAVDGNAAAGKTTFAENLGEILGAEIIHADDFFLPFELRNENRLKEAGGNIHYERLKEEVIDNLHRQKVFTYNVFDCHQGKITRKAFCMNKCFTILEGSYSCHPYLGDYADIKVFAQIDEKTQKERILNRNGEEMLKNFENKWIPMENRYFETFGIKEKADFVI